MIYLASADANISLADSTGLFYCLDTLERTLASALDLTYTFPNSV